MHALLANQWMLEAGSKHRGGEVITILSGKGGVGKTNLALNLSLQLARRDRRVILLDADFGLANADILLNVAPLGSLADVLDPTRSVADLLVEVPGGLRVLCGATTADGRSDGRRLGPRDCTRALARLAADCEALVVDCGTAVNETLVAFALASHFLILTTTPEPTALADCYATLKFVRQYGYMGHTGVVVNMARSRREAEQVARRLAHAAHQFLGLSVESLGYIPVDRHVPEAVRARVPLTVRYPRCPASASIEQISSLFVPPVRAAARPGGVWSRLATLFL